MDLSPTLLGNQNNKNCENGDNDLQSINTE